MRPADFYLIRGLARESAHWGSFAKKLEKLDCVGAVIGLDLLGAGQFYKLTSPISIRENAEFLLSQIPKDNNHPKVLLSVSLGSMVAIEMAQLQPHLFAKVFVTNTSFSNLSPIHHRLQLDAFKHFYNIGKAKSLEERELEVLRMVSRNQKHHPEICKKWVEIAEARPMPLKNFFRQLIAAGTYKIADHPPDIPIVVMRSMGDEMVDPSCSQKLANHWNLPIHTHPSSGHDIFIDDPDWVIDVIQSEMS